MHISPVFVFNYSNIPLILSQIPHSTTPFWENKYLKKGKSLPYTVMLCPVLTLNCAR